MVSGLQRNAEDWALRLRCVSNEARGVVGECGGGLSWPPAGSW
jgi:hypothetical protein